MMRTPICLISMIVILAVMGLIWLASADRTRAAGATLMTAASHFTPGKTYLFGPANGAGEIRCKVLEVDGTWLRCEESVQWINTAVMLSAKDSR